MATGKEEIREFVEKAGVDRDATPNEFKAALKGAYMDRSRQIYFIWRKIQELYPDVDADRVIRDASWDFGVWQGERIKARLAGKPATTKDVLLGQTSRGGMQVFEQEILELDDARSVKMFNACPHVEAFRELGATPEEVKRLCRDMLSACDYGICAPFPDVELQFPTTVADGEGCGCEMVIRKAKPHEDVN